MLVRRVLTRFQALPVLVIAIYSYCAFRFGLFSFALSFFSVFKLLAWEWCGWSFQYDGMTLRCLLRLRVVQNDVLALVSWLVTTKYRGYVPGSVSLQVIRDGIQQLVIVVSFTRLLVLRCTYHFVFKYHVPRGTYIHTFVHMHVSLGLIATTINSTRVYNTHPLRPSKWHVPATTEHYRGFGTLIPPRPYPTRTWGAQLNLDSSRFRNSGRRVYVWSLSIRNRDDKRVRYVFGQSPAWCSWGVF